MNPPKKSKADKGLCKAISDLIYGWWDSIMKAPEIKKILSNTPKNYFRKKRFEITDCASDKFLNDHDGVEIIKTKQTNNIMRFIILSVKECMNNIVIGNNG